ncbi:MAG: cupin domain-containing protein [Bryobacteraceae bacterium]
MNRRELLAMGLALPALAADPLAQRIQHTEPSKYRYTRSHDSAGDMACERMFNSKSLETNLGFIDRCQITPGGGVGHHFHNQCEEMFIIFDGQAEFTIDGRTSVLKGTMGAPCRMGHSHAIYNASREPVEFMNINVSAIKGHYDAFNLDDPRTHVAMKDPIPVFMTMNLDKKLLRPVPNYHNGHGTAQYRRALDWDVFLTNWSYIDQLLLPPRASDGVHRHRYVEEIYYVLNGEGEATVNDETAQIRKGDAIPALLNQAHSFVGGSGQGLELMIIGISTRRGIMDTELGPGFERHRAAEHKSRRS